MQVRVVRGSLRGLVGEVVYAAEPEVGVADDVSSGRLLIRLDILGCATVKISPLDLQPCSA
ncbi:MAG: hypothetical protein K2G82_05375, partial [Paramuribaculum sp.]|nr:hypothetical protein [Paramuribaculum sp.]